MEWTVDRSVLISIHTIHCAFKRALSKKWTLLWRLSLGDDVVNNLGPLWCSVRVVDDMPRGRTKSGRGPDPARGPRLARGWVRTYDKDIWPVLSRCGCYISSFVVYICGHHYLFLGLFSTNVFWVNRLTVSYMSPAIRYSVAFVPTMTLSCML